MSVKARAASRTFICLSLSLSLFTAACSDEPSPADEDELARANNAYSGAKALIEAQTGVSDVYFPSATRGYVYESGIGLIFTNDSVEVKLIDSTAFVVGHLRMNDGSGGTFEANMRSNGRGGWEQYTAGDVVGIRPYGSGEH